MVHLYPVPVPLLMICDREKNDNAIYAFFTLVPSRSLRGGVVKAPAFYQTRGRRFDSVPHQSLR